MNNNYLKLCAWCGPIFSALFILGFIWADFVPPLDPAATAEQIAAIYRENSISMRLGFILMMVALSLLVPFSAAIAVQMKNIANSSPALLLSFIMSATATIALLYIVLCSWGVASFRADRAPEVLQAFNDFAFIMLIWPVSLIPVQYIALGLSVLSDKKSQPLFPRWYGFYNFWMALLAYGGALLLFFTKGPFAWNGVVAFWIPAFAFFGWYIVSSIMLLLSIYSKAAPSKTV